MEPTDTDIVTSVSIRAILNGSDKLLIAGTTTGERKEGAV
jgi:hypothetical protein